MPSSNLGHGRGPFAPRAFFAPAFLAGAIAVGPAIDEGATPSIQVSQQTTVVYIYAGDDFAPQQQQVALDDGENTWQVTLTKRPPVPLAPVVDEDFPVLSAPAAPTILGDNAGPFYTIAPQATRIAYVYGTEDMPQLATSIAIDDDEGYTVRPTSWIRSAQPIANEEFPALSAPAGATCFGDNASPFYTVTPSRTQVVYVQGEDFPQLTAPPTGFPIDEDWIPSTPAKAPRIAQLPLLEDDLPQQPYMCDVEGVVWVVVQEPRRVQAFTDGDDFAPPQGPVVVQVGPAVLRWIALGIGSLVPGGASFFRHSRQNRRGRR